MLERESVMKIGIVINHDDNTIESDLQTWALHKTLNGYGFFPYVIHYHPKRKDQVSNPSSFLFTHVNLLGNAETLEELKQSYLPMDCYISVYDELYQKGKKEDDFYSLKFVENSVQKIAYGWYVKSKKRKSIIKNFEQVSFQRCSSKMEIKEPTIVSDPIIWMKRKEVEGLRDELPTQEPFLFYDIAKTDSRIEEMVHQIANEKQLKLINGKKFRKDVTRYLAWASQGNVIITDTMIGVYMAILYEKPFIYLETDHHKNRVLPLLRQLKLLYHVQKQTDQITDEALYVREKVGSLNRKMIALRQKSLLQLESILKLTNQEEMVSAPIPIQRKECYGCYACASVCPSHALTMEMDREGFYYPKVDEEKCQQCKLCEAVCIRLKDMNMREKEFPILYKVCQNQEQEEKASIFTALSRKVIEKGGVVFGSKYDSSMNIVMSAAENKEELKDFIGTKYGKTELQGIFSQVKKYLEQGKIVLYSGVSCECAGLRSYLGKSYDNLILYEVFCRSTASPKIFEKYINYLQKKFKHKVTNFCFYEEIDGKTDLLQIEFEGREPLTVKSKKNYYMQTFYKTYLNRPSCSQCQFTTEQPVGDIVVKNVYDEKKEETKYARRVSIETKKGKEWFECIQSAFQVERLEQNDNNKKYDRKPVAYKNERTELFNQIETVEINGLLQKFYDER